MSDEKEIKKESAFEENEYERGDTAEIKALRRLLEGEKDRIEEKDLDVKKKKEKERVIILEISDKAGNEVELELKEDIYNLWRYSGEYFAGGRVPTEKDVRDAIDKMKKAREDIEEQIEKYKDDGENGKAGLLGAVVESLEEALDDALVNLFLEPAGDSIKIKKEFAEKFDWETIKNPIAELVSEISGRDIKDVMKTIENMEHGEMKSAKHITTVETVSNILKKKGVEVKNIFISRESVEKEVLEAVETEDRGSHIKINPVIKRKVVESLETKMYGDTISLDSLDDERYHSVLEDIAGLLPTDVREKYGREVSEKIIDAAVKTILGEVIKSNEDGEKEDYGENNGEES